MFKKMQALALLAAASVMSSPAFAQSEPSAIETILDAVTFGAVTTKVTAVAIVIVGIALAFKGPDIAKRLIRKV